MFAWNVKWVRYPTSKSSGWAKFSSWPTMINAASAQDDDYLQSPMAPKGWWRNQKTTSCMRSLYWETYPKKTRSEPSEKKKNIIFIYDIRIRYRYIIFFHFDAWLSSFAAGTQKLDPTWISEATWITRRSLALQAATGIQAASRATKANWILWRIRIYCL